MLTSWNMETQLEQVLHLGRTNLHPLTSPLFHWIYIRYFFNLSKNLHWRTFLTVRKLGESLLPNFHENSIWNFLLWGDNVNSFEKYFSRVLLCAQDIEMNTIKSFPQSQQLKEPTVIWGQLLLICIKVTPRRNW